MTEQERIQQWLLETVRLMVDRPDDVKVQPTGTGDSISLRVSVHPSDIGKMIGKTGRTARSLRTIGTAIAMAHRTRFALDIIEG
jgi:predicted RNA-binding protein YlqC (UPF0109 family)